MKTLKKTIDRTKRRARIKAKIRGTQARPRLVIFRSMNKHYLQLVDDDKGITIASVSDYKDDSKGTKSEKAKQLGIKIAELAKEKKVTTCVFDRNGYRYQGRVKAIADGAREGGLKF